MFARGGGGSRGETERTLDGTSIYIYICVCTLDPRELLHQLLI